MRKKRIIVMVATGIVVVAIAGSGWIYGVVSKNSQIAKNNELATLQTTFTQQYGGQAVIKQLVSPQKVYAALWTDSAGASHISWNIGGLWVTVYNSSANITSP